MIILYTSPGCASCRKARKWLKDHQLSFVEKNIFSTLLNEDEIKYLLSRSENGTEDLISTRSKPFQQLGKNIETLSMKEIIEFIQENPSVMKRPIIINKDNFLVGYDDDEITAFVPVALRQEAKLGCNSECPNYKMCGAIRETEIDEEKLRSEL